MENNPPTGNQVDRTDCEKPGKERNQTKIRLIIFIALIVAALIFSIVDPEGFDSVMSALSTGSEAQGETVESAVPAESPRALEVYFLDVGQGDSIFLRSPNGKTMLIDAGESMEYEAVNKFLTDENVEKLDVVVATHPHSDHIGAMYKVIRDYTVGKFYLSDITNNTSTYERMLENLDKKNITPKLAWGGDRIKWDSDVTVRVLSPVKDKAYDNMNDWSVVLNVTYGDTSILLTGDAETYAENIMLSQYPAEYFDCTVLKLGHHGSSTSTGKAFFEAASPDVVVISVGEGNDYGHPHRETLELLSEWGGPYYRTDERGTIKIALDGTTYSVTTEK